MACPISSGCAPRFPHRVNRGLLDPRAQLMPSRGYEGICCHAAEIACRRFTFPLPYIREQIEQERALRSHLSRLHLLPRTATPPPLRPTTLRSVSLLSTALPRHHRSASPPHHDGSLFQMPFDEGQQGHLHRQERHIGEGEGGLQGEGKVDVFHSYAWPAGPPL